MLSADRVIVDHLRIDKYPTIDRSRKHMTSTHLDVSEIKVNITDGFYHVCSHAMASMKDKSNI